MLAISGIGPKAKEAIPVLIQSLGDSEPIIARKASIGLGNIGKDAIPALVKALGNPSSEVKENAALSLAMIGPDAKEALPALKKLQADTDYGVIRAVGTAIAEIEETPGRPAVTFSGRNKKRQ